MFYYSYFFFPLFFLIISFLSVQYSGKKWLICRVLGSVTSPCTQVVYEGWPSRNARGPRGGAQIRSEHIMLDYYISGR